MTNNLHLNCGPTFFSADEQVRDRARKGMFRWVRKFSTIYSVQRKFLVTFRWIVSRTCVRRTIKGCKFSLLSHFAAPHPITVPLSVFIFHVNYNFWIKILISFCATSVTFSNCVTMEGKHIEEESRRAPYFRCIV